MFIYRTFAHRCGRARRHGRTPKSASPQRDGLINNIVIYAPRHGLIDFTDPHCGTFPPRRYPLASPGYDERGAVRPTPSVAEQMAAHPRDSVERDAA